MAAPPLRCMGGRGPSQVEGQEPGKEIEDFPDHGLHVLGYALWLPCQVSDQGDVVVSDAEMLDLVLAGDAKAREKRRVLCMSWRFHRTQDD